MRRLPDDVLVVTDRHQSARSLPEQVERLLRAGARWLWLRDRDLPGAERHALARTLRAVTRAHGAALTIGADIALAEAVGADGVHLRDTGQIAEARERLGADTLIGVSSHAPDEIAAVARAGADYVTLSPIFASASKPGYGPALGIPALTEAARHGLPVVALGGIEVSNARACREAGAVAMAVMGAAMRAAQPARLLNGLRRGSGLDEERQDDRAVRR